MDGGREEEDGGPYFSLSMLSRMCVCACVSLCGGKVCEFFFFFVSPEMTRVADDDEDEGEDDDNGVLWVRVQSVHDIII